MKTRREERTQQMKKATAGVFLVITASLQSVAPAPAKDKPAYERGVLLQMDSTHCGYAEKDGKTLKGEILGTDGQHKNTQEVLCQEYILKSDRLIYRIRPKDDKHPALLPVGESNLHCTKQDAPSSSGSRRQGAGIYRGVHDP